MADCECSYCAGMRRANEATAGVFRVDVLPRTHRVTRLPDRDPTPEEQQAAADAYRDLLKGSLPGAVRSAMPECRVVNVETNASPEFWSPSIHELLAGSLPPDVHSAMEPPPEDYDLHVLRPRRGDVLSFVGSTHSYEQIVVRLGNHGETNGIPVVRLQPGEQLELLTAERLRELGLRRV